MKKPAKPKPKEFEDNARRAYAIVVTVPSVGNEEETRHFFAGFGRRPYCRPKTSWCLAWAQLYDHAEEEEMCSGELELSTIGRTMQQLRELGWKTEIVEVAAAT